MAEMRSTQKAMLQAFYVPGALTAVSLKGTIGLDAWISTLAKRSRKSFRHL
jgi:hypothetical protein